jgi:arylamine N-acetyltransferase
LRDVNGDDWSVSKLDLHAYLKRIGYSGPTEPSEALLYDSWFTWQPIIVKRDPDAIRSVVGRSYTAAYAGRALTRGELTDKEFAAALTGEFGLVLTSDELEVLVKSPTGRDK